MQPKTSETPTRKRLKLTELIFLLITLVLIGLLVHLLIGYVSLKHEVGSARLTTARVLRDVRTLDAADAYNLGDTSFKSKNPTAQLQSVFKAAEPGVAGSSSVAHQTVSNSPEQHDVSIIYKFAGKQPYYLRVIVRQPHGSQTWELINLAGDTSEQSLL
jgi:hypothetical protein